MVTPAIGAVVLVRFPFSDLSGDKLRPALVLADAGRDDWVLCQITSQPYGDPRTIELRGQDFVAGSLDRVSYVRVAKLFTANRRLMTGKVAQVSTGSLHMIIDEVVALMRAGLN